MSDRIAAVIRGREAVRANMVYHSPQNTETRAVAFSTGLMLEPDVRNLLTDLRHLTQVMGFDWDSVLAASLDEFRREIGTGGTMLTGRMQTR